MRDRHEYPRAWREAGATLAERWQQVVVARWRIAQLLRHGGPAPVAVLALVNIALGALPVLFIVATSVLVGQVPAAVRDGVGSPAWDALVTAFAVAALAFGGQQILAQAQSAVGDLLARRVDGRVADELMDASLRSPGIGPLEDPALLNLLGEAARDLEHGAQSPGRAGAGLLALVARYVQLGGCVLVVGLRFSWTAALGVLAVTMMFRYGQRGGLRKYARLYPLMAPIHRQIVYLRRLATYPPAAKEIRIFGLLDWLMDRYQDVYRSWLRPVWAARRRIYVLPYLAYAAVGVALTATVFAALGSAAARDRVTVADLALVAQAVLAATRSGDYYPEADVQTQFGMNSYAAVRAFSRGVDARLATSPPVGMSTAATPVTATPDRPTPNGSLPTAPREAIRFERVTFRYAGQDRPVLDGLDLTIPIGRCTAIVGLNGAGKTTLVKLLARLYEPDSGRITVDGVDLRGIEVSAWRRRLGVIFQDFVRYETSLADNIGFGALAQLGDRTGIMRAARAAGLSDVVDRLPAGLDTPATREIDGGVELSGGQWQRLAIARALFAADHGASILVVDEPTASLDIRAEAQFIDEMIGLTRRLTTVVISHRFSTVRHADAVAVLGQGRVVEHGTHEELLARDGRYARLFRLQAARFADEETMT